MDSRRWRYIVLCGDGDVAGLAGLLTFCTPSWHVLGVQRCQIPAHASMSPQPAPGCGGQRPASCERFDAIRGDRSGTGPGVGSTQTQLATAASGTTPGQVLNGGLVLEGCKVYQERRCKTRPSMRCLAMVLARVHNAARSTTLQESESLFSHNALSTRKQDSAFARISLRPARAVPASYQGSLQISADKQRAV